MGMGIGEIKGIGGIRVCAGWAKYRNFCRSITGKCAGK
jgi:hypothetical protein